MIYTDTLRLNNRGIYVFRDKQAEYFRHTSYEGYFEYERVIFLKKEWSDLPFIVLIQFDGVRNTSFRFHAPIEVLENKLKYWDKFKIIPGKLEAKHVSVSDPDFSNPEWVMESIFKYLDIRHEKEMETFRIVRYNENYWRDQFEKTSYTKESNKIENNIETKSYNSQAGTSNKAQTKPEKSISEFWDNIRIGVVLFIFLGGIIFFYWVVGHRDDFPLMSFIFAIIFGIILQFFVCSAIGGLITEYIIHDNNESIVTTYIRGLIAILIINLFIWLSFDIPPMFDSRGAPFKGSTITIPLILLPTRLR